MGERHLWLPPLTSFLWRVAGNKQVFPVGEVMVLISHYQIFISFSLNGSSEKCVQRLAGMDKSSFQMDSARILPCPRQEPKALKFVCKFFIIRMLPISLSMCLLLNKVQKEWKPEGACFPSTQRHYKDTCCSFTRTSLNSSLHTNCRAVLSLLDTGSRSVLYDILNHINGAVPHVQPFVSVVYCLPSNRPSPMSAVVNPFSKENQHGWSAVTW